MTIVVVTLQGVPAAAFLVMAWNLPIDKGVDGTQALLPVNTSTVIVKFPILALLYFNIENNRGDVVVFFGTY